MSYKVSEIVAEQSEAGANARLLLYALAETAYHDGVAWNPIDFAESDPDWKKRDSLRWRMGKPHEKTVRLAIDAAQMLDELEVVIAYDGRRRFHIYRVIIGALRERPVDYDRGLPRLAAFFWTQDELLLPKEERPAKGHRLPWTRVSRPGNSPGRQSDELAADDRADDPLTAGDLVLGRVGPGAHPYTSLDHVPDSLLLCSTSEEVEQQQPAQGDAAAANALDLRLKELKIVGAEREQALADPARAIAWLELVAAEAKRNPAGMFSKGFGTGDWPSPRIETTSPHTRLPPIEAKKRSIAALVEFDGDGDEDDEIRYLIDVEWDTLTSVERSELHEHLAELRSGTPAERPQLRAVDAA